MDAKHNRGFWHSPPAKITYSSLFLFIIQTTIWALLPICTLAVVSRLFIRLHLYRRRNRRSCFEADDALLCFATACAIAAAGVSLHFVDDLYFATQSWQQQPVSRVSAADLERIVERSLSGGIAGMELGMLSICAVKFSFLAFFRQLLHGQAGRIRAGWWAALGVTGGASMFMLLAGILMCPHVGNFKKFGKFVSGPQTRKISFSFHLFQAPFFHSSTLCILFDIPIEMAEEGRDNSDGTVNSRRLCKPAGTTKDD